MSFVSLIEVWQGVGTTRRSRVVPLGCSLQHFTADGGRTGEGHLGHVHVVREGVADLAAVAGQDVDHARRETGLDDELPDVERRQGRLVRGLQDDRATGAQGRRELPRLHHQRELQFATRPPKIGLKKEIKYCTMIES